MLNLNWQKSSFSEPNGTECIELAASTDAVHIRESDDPDRVVTAPPSVLAALIHAIKAGTFDTTP